MLAKLPKQATDNKNEINILNSEKKAIQNKICLLDLEMDTKKEELERTKKTIEKLKKQLPKTKKLVVQAQILDYENHCNHAEILESDMLLAQRVMNLQNNKKKLPLNQPLVVILPQRKFELH